MSAAGESRTDREPDQVLRLRAVLDAAHARYRILRHDATVSSARDGADLGFGKLAQMAPTLILRSEQGYLAAIIGGDRRLSYGKIRRHLGIRDVSLASPADVLALTGAEIGSVALVNPGLRTLVDRELAERGEVFGGCGVPYHSLAIQAADLIRTAAAEIFDFTEPRNR
ncbi:MAG: YbaK/EbsC family protein [Gammaproteobacteria bacterium]|nr:YbaK/EbsC family protein [Gammaproteobacteria bacterium]